MNKLIIALIILWGLVQLVSFAMLQSQDSIEEITFSKKTTTGTGITLCYGGTATGGAILRKPPCL